MLKHCKAAHVVAAATQASILTASAIPPVCTASHAAHAQKLGMARLNALNNALERTLSGRSEATPSSNASEPASSQLTELSTKEAEAAEHWAVELDEQPVNSEIHRYQAAGILTGNELDDFDILQYWQVSFI